jgi:hypothetical protein
MKWFSSRVIVVQGRNELARRFTARWIGYFLRPNLELSNDASMSFD